MFSGGWGWGVSIQGVDTIKADVNDGLLLDVKLIDYVSKLPSTTIESILHNYCMALIQDFKTILDITIRILHWLH